MIMKYKKERGQKRKVKALLNNINQIYPFQNTDCKCEHFYVPSGQFISSPKTRGEIKTAFCKAWLDKTIEIIEQKPCGLSFCRVVAFIAQPLILLVKKNFWKAHAMSIKQQLLKILWKRRKDILWQVSGFLKHILLENVCINKFEIEEYTKEMKIWDTFCLKNNWLNM